MSTLRPFEPIREIAFRRESGYTEPMSSRYVYAAAALLSLAAVYGCFCRVPLIFDGAYQFDMTLAMQRPYVYLTRFHTWFLWWPTVWASRVTDNVMLLQSLFGLPFLLAPAIGLLLSWWMVHRAAPHQIIWVVFGVAAGTLPGQIFVINDSILQLHLFWPVLMGMLSPLNGPKRIVIALLIVFQFPHPIGAPLFLGAAVATGLLAIVDLRHRRRFILRAALMLSLLPWPGRRSSLPIMCRNGATLRAGASQLDHRHGPMAGVRPRCAAGWIAMDLGGGGPGLPSAFCQEVQRHGRNRHRRHRVAAGGTRSDGMALLAHGPDVDWGGAIDYRRWAGPLTAPFFALAALEGLIDAWRVNRPHASDFSPVIHRDNAGGTLPRQNSSSPELQPRAVTPNQPRFHRGPMAVALTLLFVAVFGMQCAAWDRLTTRLMSDVRAYPSAVVPMAAPQLVWIRRTPLAHWATGNYVSAMLGKTPDKVFLDPYTEIIFNERPRRWTFYVSWPDSPPGPAGWFDFRPLLRKLDEERSTTQARQ